MAENNVVFTNNTTKLLYPKEQHFWSGTPVSAPGGIPPRSTAQGKQRATAAGALKFATVYVDSQEELPTTRKFISAFDISVLQGPEEYGPYGSQLPRNYSMILGQDESIKEIIVRHSEVIDAIGFVVADKTGTTSTKMFGGTGGDLDKISLKSGEYITQISGTYRRYFQFQDVINTLTIHTNLNPSGYGPFGKDTSQPQHNQRNFESARGPIVGFFGKHDIYVESIGLFMSNGATTKEYGPYGSPLPINYSMILGQDESIKEIIVRHSEVIDAIGFVVADKTGTTSTKMFGGTGGDLDKISLKSDEYITQISGTYRRYFQFSEVVNRLRIRTNLNPSGYGPFGKETSQPQHNQRNFESESGPIVGFFGRHDKYVESIGLFISTGATPGPGPAGTRKAYAESGPIGPIDWNVVEVRLGLSAPSVVYVDDILGSKVEAAVSDNGDATVVISDK